MRLRGALALAMLLGSMARAEPDIAGTLAAAEADLTRAAAAYEASASADDQIAALGAALRAYETALQRLGNSTRQAAQPAPEALPDPSAARDELTRLLPLMRAMAKAPDPALHPRGPTGAAQAGFVLEGLRPALEHRIGTLRSDVTARADADRALARARQSLTEGDAQIAEIRAALARAIEARGPLPRSFSEDPVQTALIIASADTLSGLVSALAQSQRPPAGAPAADALQGQLALPVAGWVAGGFSAPGPDGTQGLGMRLAARPLALVTAPVLASVRFSGALADLGQVVVLEPAPGLLMVLAGLGESFVQVGEVLHPGAPIGLMAGAAATDDAIVTADDGPATGGSAQSLYIEIRADGASEDPTRWFTTD